MVTFLFVGVPAIRADGNSWASKAPMPQGGAVYGAVVVDGKIYAFGCYYYNGVVYSTSGEYNPTINTWIAKAPMPSSRIDFATATYGT